MLPAVIDSLKMDRVSTLVALMSSSSNGRLMIRDASGAGGGAGGDDAGIGPRVPSANVLEERHGVRGSSRCVKFLSMVSEGLSLKSIWAMDVLLLPDDGLFK